MSIFANKTTRYNILQNVINTASRPALSFACIFFLLFPLSVSADCVPFFPYKDGWYGGDGGYSIKLDEKRTLWLFGDTFVSDGHNRQDRVDMDVVLGTTLAISACSPAGQFDIKYYLKKSNEKYVSSFGEDEWLWPQDPFIVNRILYIPLIAVEAKPDIEGPFKFRISGHKIAKVTNYGESDPDKWTIEYIDFTPGILEGVIAFATTSILYQNHVYYYPLYASSKVYGNILARIHIDQLNDPAKAVEYFTKDGIWKKYPNPSEVKIIIDAGVSELSVRYHQDDKKWVAVYMSVGNNGDRLLFQAADKPEGPWSEPKVLIGSIPEVDPKSNLYDRNNFCYAGKEHIEFMRGNDLIVTYVCNSFEDFQNNAAFIRKNLFLYRPVVRIVNYN